MNTCMKRALEAVILTCSLAIAAGATPLSDHLLALSGRKAGICSLPRCIDGRFALDLAQNSKLLVYALCNTPEQVATARKAAHDTGFLGRAVYVDQGSVAHNPLSDWSADVLLIDDATDAALAQIPPKEVRRVLSPYRGVAVVGRAKELGAELTRAELEAWLKVLDVPGGKIVEDDFGIWAIATMPPLVGGDDWTHYAHGADQNRNSSDDTLKWPYLLQWTAKPYFDGKFDMAVSAGGRLFRANATLAVDKTRTDGIIARSAYNGNILWKRKTSDTFGTFGSLIVATPDVVYVKDDNGVLCLDAETGTVRQRYALSDDPQLECQWLMLQDGVLVTVLGQKPPLKSLRELPYSLTRGQDEDTSGNSIRNFMAQQKWFEDYDQGTALVATDVTTGKELWRIAANRIDPAKTVIASNRVFFYADRSYASCVDLKTGKPIWKTDAPIYKDPQGVGWSITSVITERVGALASADVYLINSVKDGHYQAFSAKDGHILWGEGHGRSQPITGLNGSPPGETKLGYPVFVDDKILSRDGKYYNPFTGKITGNQLPISYGGCGSWCISTHAVHGMMGTVYDRDSNSRVVSPGGYMKAACLSGVIAADGILQSGHGACVACMEWVGHIALEPAGHFSLTTTPETERLFTGKPYNNKAVADTNMAWTTYRANNSRSSSSRASIPPTAQVRWTWTPNPPFDMNKEEKDGMETSSTQAISIGDRVIFGAATGVLYCVDRTTGKELWNYPTGGRIISSPSFWEGKVYAGSGDGNVYCLNAIDGNLLWRYRVAPVERRIMVFGNMMSAWPINANVLVQPSAVPGHDGAVAFASAGLICDTGGTVLCALDARTGTPLWESKYDGQSALIPSATGQMAWSDGKLWLHSPAEGVFIINPATGKTTSAIDWDQLKRSTTVNSVNFSRFSTVNSSKGQDIGILPGGYVVVGGKQFYVSANDLVQQRNTCTILRTNPDGVPVNPEGYPDVLALPKCLSYSTLPAWDDKETLFPGGNGHLAMLCAALPDQFTAALAAHPFNATAHAKIWWNEGLINSVDLPEGQQRCAIPVSMKREKVLSPILAANAIVFFSGYGADWHVYAVNRVDATLLWTVNLRGQPVVNGLSLTSAGDVLVPMVDGRVVCIGGGI